MKKLIQNKNKKDISKIWKILTTIVFCSLGIHLLLYIFVFSKALLNSDSAFIVDYALEAIKYNTIFPKTWANTNDFWIYSLIPIIIPFIKMGFSLFLSRQFAVLIQTLGLIILVISFYKTFFNEHKSWIIFLIILLSGISGQFMFEMFSDATYGTIVLFILLEIYLAFKYIKEKKPVHLVLLCIILTLITACSMRFPIYISAPLICVCLFNIYDKEKLSKQTFALLITVIISTIIGYIINKYLCSHLIMSHNYNSYLLGGIDEVGNSVNSLIYYYLTDMGVTNVNLISLTTYMINTYITSDSPLVIIAFIKMIFSIITLIIPFALLIKLKKLKEYEKYLLIFVISLMTILGFFLFAFKLSISYRYLIPIIFMLIMLYPMFYNYYFSNKLKNKFVFASFIFLSTISSLFLTFTTYYNYQDKHLKKNSSQEIADFLLSKDLHFGYTYHGNEHNIYRTITNNKLQITIFCDNGTPLYWLVSTDWFNKEYYDEKVFFMRRSYQPEFALEKEAVEKYKFDDYVIFVYDSLEPFEKVYGNVNKAEGYQFWR